MPYQQYVDTGGTFTDALLFALHIRRPPPLHRRVVEVGGDGSDFATAIAEIKDAATTCAGDLPVAIALRNSYRDPSVEQAIGDSLRHHALRYVSRSSDLAPLIRLLPRVQTTVIDAYLTIMRQTHFLRSRRDHASALLSARAVRGTWQY